MNTLHDQPHRWIHSLHDINYDFALDVKKGLESRNKNLYSKYLYDEKGCELFNKISRHPDYYLTNTEIEILQSNKHEISKYLQGSAFNLIDLGPGEGKKSQILIEQFNQDNLNFTYMPVDISENFLSTLHKKFTHQFSNINISAIHSDYFHSLDWIYKNTDRPNLLLFLGSNIGNFDFQNMTLFLQHVWDNLHDGDYILLGFDLIKDINKLFSAYNDSEGITRQFNINILERINRELGGNFNTNRFIHYPTYNTSTGAMESYLISTTDQSVDIEAHKKSYQFEENEAILIEYSHKYRTNQIEKLGRQCGFKIVKTFVDKNNYFIDSLWRADKNHDLFTKPWK